MKIYVVWGDYVAASDYSKVIFIARTYKQAKNFIKSIEKDKTYADDGLYYVETYVDNWNGQVYMTDWHYGTPVETLCKRVFCNYHGEDK